ncbi:MAG: hypothetical protein NT023_10635, partial [Armatimonadetes bacterium]|nr:hypothetical protein [Armatimonadota bacterium]
EAKVHDRNQAVEQALLNRWFATSSNILLPRLPSSNLFVAQAHSLGIGIWSLKDTCLDTRNMVVQSKPVSYASWLFNEWAWRFTVTEFTNTKE